MCDFMIYCVWTRFFLDWTWPNPWFKGDFMYTNTWTDSKVLRFIIKEHNFEIQTPKRVLKTAITCDFYVFLSNQNKTIFTVDFDSTVQDQIPLVLDGLNYFYILSHRTYKVHKTVQTEFILTNNRSSMEAKMGMAHSQQQEWNNIEIIQYKNLVRSFFYLNCSVKNLCYGFTIKCFSLLKLSRKSCFDSQYTEGKELCRTKVLRWLQEDNSSLRNN